MKVLAFAIAALASCSVALAGGPGNAVFAANLYRQLSTERGNVFFSPYSVASAMGMAWAGAEGQTKAEIGGALQLGAGAKCASFADLAKSLDRAARSTGQSLDSANALCLTGATLGPDYVGLLRRDFGAEVFSGGLGEINGWVKKRTRGKIPEIFSRLDANSACVLLNAVYFRGAWLHAFDAKKTAQGAFFSATGDETRAPFMHRKGDYRLFEEGAVQALELPYRGDHLQMVVVLPKKRDGLQSVEKDLTEKVLSGWLAGLGASAPQEVEVSLPKFKLENAYDLAHPLKALGVVSAFGAGKADFAPMGCSRGDLYISQVAHKACVEVNEEGTEAAAATAVELSYRGVPRPPKAFRADHPFLFFIRDKESGTILFMGRVSDPTEG